MAGVDHELDLGMSPRTARLCGLGGPGREQGKAGCDERKTPHYLLSSSDRLGSFRLKRVDFQARPELSPEEAEALRTALAEFSGSPGNAAGYLSVWRLAGLLDDVAFDARAPDGLVPTGSRSSSGASRA